MRTLYLIVSILLSLPVSAQSITDTVMYRFTYATEIRNHEKGKRNSDELRLDIGKHFTRFYSRWKEGNQAIMDSVKKAGGSSQDMLKARVEKGFPASRFNYTLIKNYPQPRQLTEIWDGMEDLRYEETTIPPQWELTEGDTIILDYPCKKAKTTYRGRTWVAWYAMDLPLQEGPWKLSGLPGLIMQAQDTAGDCSFVCIGMQANANAPYRFYFNQATLMTHKRMQEYIKLYNTDPDRFYQAMGKQNPVVQMYDAKGKATKPSVHVPIFLEKLP